MEKAIVSEYPFCFGCGADNPIGLRLKYRVEENCVITEFVPREEHQGWPGIVHGGIITTLLYEVLENYPFQNGIVAMMKGMDTKFLRPGKTETKILAKSWLIGQSGRDMNVGASLADESGKLLAEGNANMVVLTLGQKKRLGID